METEIVEKHQIRTIMSTEDFAVVTKFAKLNPEWNISFREESSDGEGVSVLIVFRNSTKREFHQRLIHFFIKAFKYQNLI